jgi:hypothetical protein
MSRPGTPARFAAAALLLLTGSPSSAGDPAMPPAFELEPALTLEPDPPRAGEVLELVLAEEVGVGAQSPLMPLSV